MIAQAKQRKDEQYSVISGKSNNRAANNYSYDNKDFFADIRLPSSNSIVSHENSLGSLGRAENIIAKQKAALIKMERRES